MALYVYFQPDYMNKSESEYNPMLTESDNPNGQVTITDINSKQWSKTAPDYFYTQFYNYTSSYSKLSLLKPFQIQGINGYGIEKVSYYRSNRYEESFLINEVYPEDPSAPFDIDFANNYTDSWSDCFLYLYTKLVGNTITYNLENCTSDTLVTSANEGETVDFKLTSNIEEGYKFTQDDCPYIEVDGEKTYFELSDNRETATLSYTFNTAGASYIIYATCKQVSNVVNYNLENCTINDESTSVDENFTKDYVLTANSGYKFTQADCPYIEVDGEKTYFELSDDRESATLSYTFNTAGATYTIYAVCQQVINLVNYNLDNCTINDESAEVDENVTKEYVITADYENHYYFDEENLPYIEVDGIKTYFNLSEDKTTASLTVSFGSGKAYTIVASAVYVTPQYYFTLDINNGTTADKDEGYYDEDTAIFLTLLSNSTDNFYFSDAETLDIAPYFYNTDTGEKINDFNLSGSVTIEGVKYYTRAYRTITFTANITAYAPTINPYDLKYYTCTENFTNVASHNTQFSFLEGSRVTYEVYVPSQWASAVCMNYPPEIQFENGDILYFDLSEDKLTATITFTVVDNFVVYAHAETPIQWHNVIEEHLEHCYLESESTFSNEKEYTLLIRSEEGYEFSDNVEIKYNGVISLDISDFEDDNTLAACEFSPSVLNGDIIIVNAVAIRATEQVSDFVHLYKVTRTILNNLAKVRFYESTGETVEIVDYGQFITNLIEIPFALDEEIIGDNANILLGTYDSKVKAPTLLYHDFTIDIGTINVVPKYENLYDYKDTDAILHLPYADDIELPLEYCMNSNLTIKYKMDLYSGNVTIKIDSTFTGTLAMTQTTNIATQIPFIQYQNNSIVANLDKLTDNGLRTAFIELKRNIPYNDFDEFGKPTIDFGKLEDYKGYLEVTSCKVEVNCTSNERDLISDILRQGIFIR